MYIFVLRSFSEIGSSCEELSGHGCVHPRAGLSGGRWLLPVSSGPRALLIKATATQASVPWKCPQLRSRGCCPPSLCP